MTATRERQGHQRAASIARDEVLRLGPEGQLLGIVSHPDGGSPQAAPTAAVIALNAGVLHRTGPHRLHVHLARRVAAQGIVGLRLDLGGIGDSTATSDATSFRESAVADTRAAMTSLGEAVGARRFVLFGVCAGADNALATALVDDRVAGVVLVDPVMYPTRRAQLRELRRRIAAQAGEGGPAQLARWAVAVAARRLRARLEQRRRRGAPQEEEEADGREIPPIEAFRGWLVTLADRGVRVLAIYAGSHGAGYNHADQIFESFPELRGRVDRAYFPDANHTFTQLDDQAALIETTAGWIARRFG